MSQDMESYLSASLEHPKTLAIKLDDDGAEYDTHRTGGEHARKESGAWRTFLDNLDATSATLPSDIEDPFDHYLFSNNGLFTRVYSPNYGTMLAGMAISRSRGGVLVLDALYSKDARSEAVTKSVEDATASMVATGVHRMITRNIIEHFSGAYGLPGAQHLSLPFNKMGYSLQPNRDTDALRLNWGLLRGLSDFALPVKGGFTIPLPGQVINIDGEAVTQEKVQEIKSSMPSRWIGVLEYSEDDDPRLYTTEFYRHAQLVGRTTVKHKDFPKPSVHSLYLADGTSLPHPEMESIRAHSVAPVRALKIFATHDPQAAKLILG